MQYSLYCYGCLVVCVAQLNTAVNVGGSVTGDNLHDVSRLKERQAFEAQQRLAKLQQRNAIGHAKDEVEYREKLDRLEQELENLRVSWAVACLLLFLSGSMLLMLLEVRTCVCPCDAILLETHFAGLQ